MWIDRAASTTFAIYHTASQGAMLPILELLVDARSPQNFGIPESRQPTRLSGHAVPTSDVKHAALI